MIKKKVITIIASALDKRVEEISIESNNQNLDDWGSVQNLFISSDVESEFDIELSPEDISNFNSVFEIVNIVENHLSS